MKKIISLLLIVCLLCTMGIAATITAVANGVNGEENVVENIVENSPIATIDDSNTVAITFVNDGETTTENIAVGANLPVPQKANATFLGWYDANGAKVLTANADVSGPFFPQWRC